jgi:hypothetical protein
MLRSRLDDLPALRASVIRGDATARMKAIQCLAPTHPASMVAER